MPVFSEPILLDVTRMIAVKWSGRQPTGIDRVCVAYLREYRESACAVVQHRGMISVLDPRRSQVLFDMLQAETPNFRLELAALAPAALLSPLSRTRYSSATYINVSHTDFDLSTHHKWARKNSLRCCYFIHDLIPIRNPEYSSPHAVKRHHGRVIGALRSASQIIVSSNAVDRDLRAFAQETGIGAPPIIVAPIAGADWPSSQPHVQADGRPYFLCLGTVEPRKNHRLLIKVWRSLADLLGNDAPRLIIAGQKGLLSEKILAQRSSDPNLSSLVQHFETLDDAQIVSLLKGARAMLLPSLAEGFGLPLVEALAQGVPVLASDIEVFKELSHGAAQLLDPQRSDLWIEAVARLAASPLADADRPAFQAPTWEAHFAKVNHALSVNLQTSPAYGSSLAA